ncbi:MAG: hypothetical protein JWN70_1743, partial [Planctomycetaceae bacterium]|nr:hypothetical protein [Planctomycetaceae bacterium]
MTAQSTTKDSCQLEFSDGSSNKFWKIELDGSSHTVTFGRIGTNGQTQTKDFPSDADARKSYDKLVAEKTKKGYTQAASTGTSPSAAPKPPPATTSTKGASADKSETAAAASATPAKGKTKKGAVEPTAGEAPQATVAVPVAGGDVDLSTGRGIDLDPVDWFRATFRKSKPLVRATPAAFDQDACVQRLAKLKLNTFNYVPRWADLHLPATLSAEEAHFWLIAISEPRGYDAKMKDFAKLISTKKITGIVTVDSARKMIKQIERVVPDEFALALVNLLSLNDYLELVLEPKSKKSTVHSDAQELMVLVRGFNKYIVPYLTDAERESIRTRIRKTWDLQSDVVQGELSCPPSHYIAAAVGMHQDVAQVVSQWSDNLFADYDSWTDGSALRPAPIVWGLGSAEMVADEWRRLKLIMYREEDIRCFLACTEYTALDLIADSLVTEADRDYCETLLKTFALVRAPEAAEPMLRCKLSAKAPAVAREWLDKYVGHATAGLIETAGGRGALADAAIEYLRGVKVKGYGATIANAVKAAGKSSAAAKVQADVLDFEVKVYEPHDAKSTPKWLATEIAAVGSPQNRPIPAWAAASLLPPLIVEDRRLNDEQFDLVMQILATTPATEKHPLLVALRTKIAKALRDEFAWKLFQFWQREGYPPKEKWAMGAIAHLGDDRCVLNLTPLIRVWPGESQHARAVFGLECLRSIGSSIALMQLSAIAQKLKFKGLKAKAEQFVTEIATERGLTRDELEDRVVPDCGLDEMGRREFSFGTRSFSFLLGGDLKAMVRDESAKIRSDLPAPSGKDDSAKASESVAEWKLLKKQIKEVATIQAGRLEQAMVTGRRWNADDFETLLVRHPLMTHLVQKLIWAGFDAAGKRVVTFRVTEERDYANPDDDAVNLKGVATVGVVHPLELTEAERERWGEVLGDYEVVSPFAQLGRNVYGLEKGEGDLDDLKRFHGMKLVAPTLVFTLEKLNWVRGVAMDGGCFDEHSKQFPAANVTAVIGYEGTVAMGYIDPDEMLKLDAIHFFEGMRKPSGYRWDSKSKMRLKQVPP